MKQVIGGKRYNTDTAEYIAEWSSGYPNDFSYLEESLYKTKKGQYFIAGEGGAMSSYAVSVGDGSSRGGGHAIRLLSEEDALSWCEENNIDADVIATHFEIEEG